jgi:osmotically inducible protein OsmC
VPVDFCPDWREMGTPEQEDIMIEKTASAVWTGNLKEGRGTVSTQSGSLIDSPYGFATRFESAKGTNPEELIGAAHASCYAMFLSALMTGAGIVPETITATSTIKLDPDTAGSPTVVAAHLTVTVKAPTDEAAIRDFAAKAKTGCPISKLLKAEITLDVTVG